MLKMLIVIVILVLGLMHYRSKDYERAIGYFDQAIALSETYNFSYDSSFRNVVMAYVKAGKMERARTVYGQLLARSSYDRKFLKLKQLE
ncbi:tetratricopeptide repeat protein [Paenibacillus sp. MMS18-CY102]|uniref:tetratricopeptide repeat protein n=1 Tax=Paenibacillus sp. MMS18-CY102 TaxID=2682849 RepID=UPI001365C54F|nr:tetratricopeptide repeat protein [Paenibacillus sp. MMS18-CY102]MWC28116.1 tetratricopeptide repeat protein [Paenibacillus sp. MMS18-CY102]